MSKTPLTDSEALRSNCGTIVSADFARCLEEKLCKAERVIKLIDAIDEFDLDGSIFWNRSNMIDNEDGLLLNCNDFFSWGCADAEPLTIEDIPELRRSYKDVENNYDGLYLFIARKRKLRPQGAMYASIKKKFWPLFDACGPPRVRSFGNPVGSDEIESYVLKKQEEKIKIRAC